MSCSEVMYQYYPYLYQRPPPPHPPPPPPHPHAAASATSNVVVGAAHPSVAHAGNHAAAAAHHGSPARPAPFQPFSPAAATASHQYDRLTRRGPMLGQYWLDTGMITVNQYRQPVLARTLHNLGPVLDTKKYFFDTGSIMAPDIGSVLA
ncbi:hypothetical protein TKK_0007688 [Trichogramma kaykai]